MLFYSRNTDVMVVLRMDDYDVGGPAEERDALLERLGSKLLIKVEDPVVPARDGSLGEPGKHLGRFKYRDAVST
eukprot:6730794-Lingulodinium_polyedra.AAC.1